MTAWKSMIDPFTWLPPRLYPRTAACPSPVAVRCAAPTHIDATRYKYDLPSSFAHGTRFDVTCQDGYSAGYGDPTTSATVMCVDGSWSALSLSCFREFPTPALW